MRKHEKSMRKHGPYGTTLKVKGASAAQGSRRMGTRLEGWSCCPGLAVCLKGEDAAGLRTVQKIYSLSSSYSALQQQGRTPYWVCVEPLLLQ